MKKTANYLNAKMRTKRKRDLINAETMNEKTKNVRKKKLIIINSLLSIEKKKSRNLNEINELINK